MAKAIDHFKMIARDDRVLVAVSGGKDSLAVWDLLIELGYQADGLYVGLGIGEYSDTSAEYARAFAAEHGLDLVEVGLRDQYGYDIPTAARATRRAPCSACGMTKRHIFDKAALEGGYTVLVTGHNLDDEAAVLFGNTLRWDVEYLARQLPVLQARRVSRRRSSRWCVSPNARQQHGASSAASTISSTNARWPPATNISPTRPRSTQSRRHPRQQGRVLLQLHRQHGAPAGWPRCFRRSRRRRMLNLRRTLDR